MVAKDIREPACYRCANYMIWPYCLAFPDGIPEDIRDGLNDHSRPIEGDGGLQFEPIALELAERHLAPIHPGTGTDQSVHSPTGEGAVDDATFVNAKGQIRSETDGDDHFADEVYSVDANYFGTEEDILVRLIEWDPDIEAWTLEIISGELRENIEESSVGSYELLDPDEDDLITWTEPGGQALEDRAVSIFGLTDDYKEAGFILTTGEMLDLSGKREGGMAGTRQLDHRDVGRAMIDVDYEQREEITGGGTDSLVYFMNETGAMRISYFGDSVAVDLATKPTRPQREVIEVLGFLAGGINALDISDEKGNLQWSGSIDDPEDISNEINRLAFEYLRNRAFITLTLRREDSVPENVRTAVDIFMGALRALLKTP